MKITGLETYLVPPRWVFLKIDTDDGVVGWGEPILEGHARTLEAKISELRDFLIGRDPLKIEDTWQSLYRNGCYRGGPILMSAISGIDMALWDIKGKAYGQPVHALLGGSVRDKIRSYCWIGGDRPKDLVKTTQLMQDQGYNAVKFLASEELAIVDTYQKLDEVVTRIGELRSAVGAQVDLAIDFHGRVHAPMAKVLIKEIETFRPMFVEDPVNSQHIDVLSDLCRSTSIPITVGERLYSRYDFKPVFENRAAAIINPDVAHAGGISEMVRIGQMAEAYDVALAPHCPLGPIALAASLQVDAVCHNAFIQEQSLGMHYNEDGDVNDYLTPESQFKAQNGYLDIPQAPGLGICIDEEVVIERSKTGHNWRAPIWRHKDGSVAEW